MNAGLETCEIPKVATCKVHHTSVSDNVWFSSSTRADRVS